LMCPVPTSPRIALGLLAVTLSLSVGTVAPALAASVSEPAAPEPEARGDSTGTDKSKGSKFLDPEDGWFDISAFLNTPGGFVPIVVPVTEPAVGYGAAGALVFIKKNEPLASGGYRKPNILAVGGMGTEDGSWAGFGAHTGSWLDDRLQTVVAGVYGSLDLDFFGIGEGSLNERPVGYDLEPAGGVVQAKYRIGSTPAQVGFGYGLVAFQATFEPRDVPPEGISGKETDSRVGGVLPAFVYDNRDNMFTPLRGFYLSAESGIFREWLGSSTDFERVRLLAIAYRPVTSRLFLGARGTVASSFGNAPFYARPYISLRGAPVMAYLGESAGSLELEARWQLWKRFSAVGFVGGGSAWNEFDEFESHRDITTGGGGIRYEIARQFGLHMGLDVAWGPNEPALYVVFGNPWFRP